MFTIGRKDDCTNARRDARFKQGPRSIHEVMILRHWVKRLDTLTAERDFDDGNEIPLSTAVNVVRQVKFIIGQLRGFVEQNG